MAISRPEMILIKGEPKTSSVIKYRFDTESGKCIVTFNGFTTFNYANYNVEILRDPEYILPETVRIHSQERYFEDIVGILAYTSQNAHKYYRIKFKNGLEREYDGAAICIEKSLLYEKNESSRFEYLKRLSHICTLPDEKDINLLAKQYDKITFVGKELSLASYLSGDTPDKHPCITPIFPFGCNGSQYKAVINALENKLSVIQGPPGTGKTQTILNIIANLVIMNKTVQIVSYNNSATENVKEKLEQPQYDLGFIIAKLGKSENKKDFVEAQTGQYPDFSNWYYNGDSNRLLSEIRDMSERIGKVFEMQERIAILRLELSSLETEKKHFEQYLSETGVKANVIKLRDSVSSQAVMKLWQRWQDCVNSERKIGFIEKVRAFFSCGIKDVGIYKLEIAQVITSLQSLFYSKRRSEILSEINNLEERVNASKVTVEDLSSKSMLYFKNALACRYGKNKERKLFTDEDMWKNADSIIAEYPVTLSTTFSAKNSLKNVVYDYLIMDEASQVDVVTGALALSTAQNAVIVGDIKQLPNIVGDKKAAVESIFAQYKVPEGYKYANSFLKSVLEVVHNVPNVLLREHYRCHPKIINFCNQKFYNGDLVIMTQDNGEEDVITAIKTVGGEHTRGHLNQRQIDVIKKEILPQISEKRENIGVIAPYRDQVNTMNSQLGDIEVDTVHKFQGREKDTIIISTVDDVLSDFSDDPSLINVAVSRAKKRLYVVVSGNDSHQNSNIADLVSYIEYNNCSVIESKVYSVFDYLYDQYTDARLEYLKGRRRVSEYDSENLMYSLISDVLKENGLDDYKVVCHVPLNMLIRNPERLDETERRYAMNPGTHLDFLIYNKISKKAVFAVEVDGYTYHHEGTVQAERDKLKDSIMRKYEVPLIRFSTVGSGEKERLVNALRQQ